MMKVLVVVWHHADELMGVRTIVKSVLNGDEIHVGIVTKDLFTMDREYI